MVKHRQDAGGPGKRGLRGGGFTNPAPFLQTSPKSLVVNRKEPLGPKSHATKQEKCAVPGGFRPARAPARHFSGKDPGRGWKNRFRGWGKSNRSLPRIRGQGFTPGLQAAYTSRLGDTGKMPVLPGKGDGGLPGRNHWRDACAGCQWSPGPPIKTLGQGHQINKVISASAA